MSTLPAKPNPFTVVPLRQPNLFQRLFKRQPRQNAILEVENLLASSPSISLKASAVQSIATRYGVNLQAAFSSELADLYGRYLRHCLRDAALSPSEIDELSRLKDALGLTDSAVAASHEAVASEVYHASVAAVLEDGKVSPDEREFLKELQVGLTLPPADAERLYAGAAHNHLRGLLDRAIADQRFDPDEEANVYRLAAQLGVKVSLDVKLAQQLARARLYWQIESGKVPEVEVDIALQRGERCYFTTDVTWYEMRTVTKKVVYGGPSARIRLAKGIYYTVGSVKAQRLTEDVMKLIDSGSIYLTNKRMIFMGRQKNTTIRMNKILDFTPYTNGVDIQKDSGKSPFLGFSGDIDVFALILDRCIREA